MDGGHLQTTLSTLRGLGFWVLGFGYRVTPQQVQYLKSPSWCKISSTHRIITLGRIGLVDTDILTKNVPIAHTIISMSAAACCYLYIPYHWYCTFCTTATTTTITTPSPTPSPTPPTSPPPTAAPAPATYCSWGQGV